MRFKVLLKVHPNDPGDWRIISGENVSDAFAQAVKVFTSGSIAGIMLDEDVWVADTQLQNEALKRYKEKEISMKYVLGIPPTFKKNVTLDSDIGIKHDNGKRRWDLLPLELVEEVIDVLMYGAENYGEGNWQKLEEPFKRWFSACMRHLTAWKKGEKTDSESGLSHLAHAACNLVFLRYLEENASKH
jgi:hypothetical protein